MPMEQGGSSSSSRTPALEQGATLAVSSSGNPAAEQGATPAMNGAGSARCQVAMMEIRERQIIERVSAQPIGESATSLLFGPPTPTEVVMARSTIN